MTEPEIHDPGNSDKIDEIFVFMSIDRSGNNGIVADILPGLGSTPLVTGSARIAEKMKPMAEEVARRTGKRVGLFRFVREGMIWKTDAGKN
jgi:hypothetical protein